MLDTIAKNAKNITAIASAIAVLVVLIEAWASVKQMNVVVESNTTAIISLESSIKEVPVQLMVEHDAGVIFSTLNYPDVTPTDQIDEKIDFWFAHSWGIQIQALINLCKHDKKTLATIIYKQNVRKYCPRFGSFVLLKKIGIINEITAGM